MPGTQSIANCPGVALEHFLSSMRIVLIASDSIRVFRTVVTLVRLGGGIVCSTNYFTYVLQSALRHIAPDTVGDLVKHAESAISYC